MDKLNKQVENNRANKVRTNKYMQLIMLGWLGVSVLLGWLLSFVVQPPYFIKYLYWRFENNISDYELFCLVMIVALLLMPLAFWLALRYGFNVVYFASGGWLFLLLSVVFFLWGLGQIDTGGDSRKLRLVRDIVNHLDWFGAVLWNFSGLYFFVILVAMVIKNKKNH